MEVKRKVREHILGAFGTGELEALKDDDPLLESGVLDSVKMFELVDFLEKEFGLSFAAGELTPAGLNTIEKIAALVEGKRR